MSAETVQEIILWIYKLALRYSYFISDLVSFQDAKLTVKFLLSAVGVFIVTMIISDAVFLLIVTNAIIAWPLAYEKKRAEIDRVTGLINLKLDEVISKIPFLMNLEGARKSDSKKQL